MNKAIILTNGRLNTTDAKTAHGLIRGTERFEIVGVIDPPTAGQDAGMVLDRKRRNIPIYESLEAAIGQIKNIDCLIIGIATVGGVLPPDMLDIVKSAIKNRISIVNGLHEYLNDKPEIAALAAEYGVDLIDIRKPKPIQDLHFWTGEIFQVKAPIIAVLGTDCAVGKRTMARMVQELCQANGINAQMIYTGQTGWMQGGKYGFILDSTLNDFVSGEVEHAIVSCWKETNPDLILIEGQSALRNPSGPCGSEFLVSGNAKYVILVHSEKRKYYDDDPLWGEIPILKHEVELIEKFRSKVIAVALNTTGCVPGEAVFFQEHYEGWLRVPVFLPLEKGIKKMLPILKAIKP